MRYSRCKRTGPEAATVSGPAIQCCFYSILRNSAGVIIIGFSKPDSRKSLSPVSRTSAFAAIAALKMGRSSASLTCDSDVFSSVGMGTNSSVSKAIERIFFYILFFLIVIFIVVFVILFIIFHIPHGVLHRRRIFRLDDHRL